MSRESKRVRGADGKMHNTKKRSGANMRREGPREPYMPEHEPEQPTDETEPCVIPGCNKVHYRRFIRGGD